MRHGLTALLSCALVLTTSPSSAIPILPLVSHPPTVIREAADAAIHAPANNEHAIELQLSASAPDGFTDIATKCSMNQTYSIWKMLISEVSIVRSTDQAGVTTVCPWSSTVDPSVNYRPEFDSAGEYIRPDEPPDSSLINIADREASFVDSTFQPASIAAYPRSPSVRPSSHDKPDFNPFGEYIRPYDPIDLTSQYEQSWLVRALDILAGFFSAFWKWILGALFVMIVFLERSLSSRQAAT